MNTQAQFPHVVKCRCQHCNQNLEFDAAAVVPGTRVNCPHCGMETALYIPHTEAAVKSKPKAKANPQVWITLAAIVGMALLIAVMLMQTTPSDAGKSFGPAFIEGLIVSVLLAASVGFYFLPAIIAHKNKKTNYTAIFVLNLLAGWTFIGWVVALVWANMKDANK